MRQAADVSPVTDCMNGALDTHHCMRLFVQILASPAAMQIRQLDALQNMAKTSSSKVVFGE